jgi:hypothetical protein
MRAPAWIKGSVLLAVTFVAGAGAGVVYERLRAPRLATVTDAHDAHHRLTAELNLDAEQQKAITAILARRQADVDATWHSMQPHMRATLDSTSQEILALLRPDQAEKFRRLIGRMHDQRHR